MRIHKLLSDNGIASRRAAEKMVAEGKVEVNGHRATVGQDVTPKDIIHIDGARISIKKKKDNFYLALNKPRGYVTTMSDELERRCVSDLIKNFNERVYPIGRLDKDSEGLLLLTNDGDFANYVMHPKNHIPKTYRVTVRPEITEEKLIDLATGVTLDDGTVTAPAQVSEETRENGRSVLRLTIHEGKNRQIRRMCEAVGLEVARLKRSSVGPVKLGMLQAGEYRELKPSEVIAMKNAIKTEPDAPNPNRRKKPTYAKNLKSTKNTRTTR